MFIFQLQDWLVKDTLKAGLWRQHVALQTFYFRFCFSLFVNLQWLAFSLHMTLLESLCRSSLLEVSHTVILGHIYLFLGFI